MEIRRPKREETEKLNTFFELVIRDTFELNGISFLEDDIQNEISTKKKYLNQDFDTDGKDRFFLIAEKDNKIIGSIEYGFPNKVILEGSNNKLEKLFEVGTVFVHPDYQKMGIGKILLNSIVSKLKEAGEKEFALDSGYESAQKIWLKKFGSPEYHLTDYWGKGYHHMIWKLKIDEILKDF